jgi:hypothetical protein
MQLCRKEVMSHQMAARTRRAALFACACLILAGCGGGIVAGADGLAKSGTANGRRLSDQQASSVLQNAQKWKQAPNTGQLAQQFITNSTDAEQALESVARSVVSPVPRVQREVACAAVNFDNADGRLPDPLQQSDVDSAAASVGLTNIPGYQLHDATIALGNEIAGRGIGFVHSLGLLCGISDLSGFADR